MVLSTLTAISPVDGRYRNKAENLAAYFSEYALIKYRVRVEIEYFITLSEFLPQLKFVRSHACVTYFIPAFFGCRDAVGVDVVLKDLPHLAQGRHFSGCFK